jgi:hypothetical protein
VTRHSASRRSGLSSQQWRAAPVACKLSCSLPCPSSHGMAPTNGGGLGSGGRPQQSARCSRLLGDIDTDARPS